MDSMNTKKNNATTWNKGLANHGKHDRSRLITKGERDHKSMIFSMPKNTHDKKIIIYYYVDVYFNHHSIIMSFLSHFKSFEYKAKQ